MSDAMNMNEPIPCCGLLRCKSMYYRNDERPGKLHESGVMDYWCLRTQDPQGPDNCDARPALCQAGRSCFKESE
jgi:hypothetical protein